MLLDVPKAYEDPLACHCSPQRRRQIYEDIGGEAKEKLGGKDGPHGNCRQKVLFSAPTERLTLPSDLSESIEEDYRRNLPDIRQGSAREYGRTYSRPPNASLKLLQPKVELLSFDTTSVEVGDNPTVLTFLSHHAGDHHALAAVGLPGRPQEGQGVEGADSQKMPSLIATTWVGDELVEHGGRREVLPNSARRAAKPITATPSSPSAKGFPGRGHHFAAKQLYQSGPPMVTPFEVRRVQQRHESLAIGAAATYKKKILRRSAHYPVSSRKILEEDASLASSRVVFETSISAGRSPEARPLNVLSSSPGEEGKGRTTPPFLERIGGGVIPQPPPAVSGARTKREKRPPLSAIDAWKMKVGLLNADREECKSEYA